MRDLVLVLALLLTCGACSESSKDHPTAVAERQCKRAYDRLMRYVTGHGSYPTTDEEWESVRTGGTDPWGNPLEIVMDVGVASVWSAGPDGVVRTEDDICYPPLD